MTFDPAPLNIAPVTLDALITLRTKALLLVHYGGCTDCALPTRTPGAYTPRPAVRLRRSQCTTPATPRPFTAAMCAGPGSDSTMPEVVAALG